MQEFIFRITIDLNYIECISAPSEMEYYSMVSYFRKKREGAWRERAVIEGYSDGCDAFFVDNKIPLGLYGEVEKYCKDRGFGLTIQRLDSFINKDLTMEEITSFMNELFKGTVISSIRWYQYESVYKILKYRYSAQQISTSAGKTMIAYSVAAYLKSKGKLDKDRKFLMIVPKKTLVGQTVKNFSDSYCNGTVELNVTGLGGDYKFKQSLFDECEVLISTFQSLNNLDDSIFKKFRIINVDEAHTAKTESITRAIRLSMPLSYRYGLSGTIMVGTGYAGYYHNLSVLGPVTMVYNPKDLISDGFAPEVNITKLTLDYSKRKDNGEFDEYSLFRDNKPEKGAPNEMDYFNKLYKLERDLIVNDEIRLNALCEYINKFKKNTLVLFNDVKGSYGKRIAEKLNENKPTKYIDGDVNERERNLYIEEIEEKNMNIVASYGTFAVGIDLKNVHHIVFAESYKSPILIGQSIGRGLRNHKTKKKIEIIDVVDSIYKHTNKQYDSRFEIYKSQNYPVGYDEIVLKTKEQ